MGGPAAGSGLTLEPQKGDNVNGGIQRALRLDLSGTVLVELWVLWFPVSTSYKHREGDSLNMGKSTLLGSKVGREEAGEVGALYYLYPHDVAECWAPD